MSKVYLKRVESNGACASIESNDLCFLRGTKRCLKIDCGSFHGPICYIPATPEEIERYKQRHGE
jgi:hypothetical protein